MYLYGQKPWKYHIGQLLLGDFNALTGVQDYNFEPQHDLRASNSPDWQHMRQEKFGQTNALAQEAPLPTNFMFPTTFVLEVKDNLPSGEVFALRDVVMATFAEDAIAEEVKRAEDHSDADSSDSQPDYETLQINAARDGNMNLWNLQDITNWTGTSTTLHPTIETSVIMVHCDRFLECDTRGQYRQENRLNL